MPAPRSAALLRELAEIALRKARLGLDPDFALRAWRRRAAAGLTADERLAALAVEREIRQALNPHAERR